MNYKILKNILIKELVKEFKGEFECLGENAEKFITFSVPVRKNKLQK